MRAITRLTRIKRGEIMLDGERIDGLSPDQIVRRGISMVQERRLDVTKHKCLTSGGRNAVGLRATSRQSRALRLVGGHMYQANLILIEGGERLDDEIQKHLHLG